MGGADQARPSAHGEIFGSKNNPRRSMRGVYGRLVFVLRSDGSGPQSTFLATTSSDRASAREFAPRATKYRIAARCNLRGCSLFRRSAPVPSCR